MSLAHSRKHSTERSRNPLLDVRISNQLTPGRQNKKQNQVVLLDPLIVVESFRGGTSDPSEVPPESPSCLRGPSGAHTSIVFYIFPALSGVSLRSPSGVAPESFRMPLPEYPSGVPRESSLKVSFLRPFGAPARRKKRPWAASLNPEGRAFSLNAQTGGRRQKWLGVGEPPGGERSGE